MNNYFINSRFGSLTRVYLPGFFISFFLFFCCVRVVAATDDPKPDLKFQHIHDGLISNQITSIYQDQFDFIWVGTNSGVQRFDGINFHTYTSSDSTTGLREGIIRGIYEDKNNNLWVGTSNYINKYNRETDSFTPYELPRIYNEESLDITIPNTILEDKKGILWVIGGSDGLYFFDEQAKQFTPYENLDIRNINSIASGNNDILWLATNGEGLIKLHTESGETEIFKQDPADPGSVSSDSITDVVIDRHGILWAGTRRAGLNKMVEENGQVTFEHYKHEPGNPNSLGNNNIYKLFADRDGNLWAGNDNGGLNLYDRENDLFYHYSSEVNNPYSLSHHSISYIFQDRMGRLWVGTGLSGLNVYDEFSENFEHFNTARTMGMLSNNIIRDFWEDNDGNIWIATDGGGLNYFDRQQRTFTAFTHNPDDPSSISSNAVISINEAPDGALWTGTWEGGINILTDKQEGTFTRFREKFGISEYPITNVFDIHFDRQFNYIWIAAFGEGLYRYNTADGEIKRFSSDPDDPVSLTSNNMFRIFEDSKNNIWAGTFYGLNLLTSENKETGIFKNFTKIEEDPGSLSGHGVRHILEDQNQNIWAATTEGISKYIEETESFVNYNKSDGLPSTEMRSMVEDDKGHFWIGTLMGLSHFDPVNETFKNYYKNDGLQADEFSRYAAKKLNTGELLFGGINGFNLFHPDNVRNNPNPPPVYFTGFRLFNEPVDFNDPDSPLDKHISVTDTLKLSHQHSVISFDFIALNYTRPEHNEYAYMVEGFENEWNYVGQQRNATYTNLDPGEYVFRVKAANNDGVWNETGASLALIITPPFWQTKWFFFLSALFICGVLISGYRIRVHRIHKHNRELEQQVADRTDELKVKNKDLQITLEELKATKDELVKKAHKAGMADIANGVLHNVGNLLNSVNTSASLIENTVKKSKITKLKKANSILREHIDNFEYFLTNSPKGKDLLSYYLKLEEPLDNERDEVLRQSVRLVEKVNLINDVIAAQQSYAGASMHADQTALSEMIDNALALQAGSIERHGLIVEKDLQKTAPILAQHSKLIHVLVNIFKNAKESMADKTPEKKKIKIKTWQDDENVYLSVKDNGSGIKPEHLNKVFSQGYTTKKNGHGFGLHSSANYMTEMDGNITVHSDGEGHGTTFTLCFQRSHSKDLEQIESSEQNSI